MICVFVFQGFLFQTLEFFLYSCDCENHVQCVKYPVFGPLYCLPQCGCDTTLPAGCCFSIKITLKAACLCLSRGSTLEGTQFQSVAEGAQSTRSVVSPKIGPSARVVYTHEQLLSPPEIRGLLLQLLTSRVLSRTNSIKEILVTDFGTQCGAQIGELSG